MTCEAKDGEVKELDIQGWLNSNVTEDTVVCNFNIHRREIAESRERIEKALVMDQHPRGEVVTYEVAGPFLAGVELANVAYLLTDNSTAC